MSPSTEPTMASPSQIPTTEPAQVKTASANRSKTPSPPRRSKAEMAHASTLTTKASGIRDRRKNIVSSIGGEHRLRIGECAGVVVGPGSKHSHSLHAEFAVQFADPRLVEAHPVRAEF